MAHQPIELKTFYGKFTLQPEGFGGRGTVYDAHWDVVFENFIVRDELAPMVNYLELVWGTFNDDFTGILLS